MIAGVPYDAEVEYLESTGTQWIDTGVKFSVSDEIRISFAVTSNSQYAAIFGAGNADGDAGASYSIYLQYRAQIVFQCTGARGAAFNYAANTRYDVSCSVLNGAMSVDEIPCGTNGTPLVSCDYNAYLFARNVAGAADRKGKLRVYSFSIPGRIDLVPVRFTNELGVSEGAMYDRVSRKLFRNAGTGAFVIGPDVATPVMGLHFFKKLTIPASGYRLVKYITRLSGNVWFPTGIYNTAEWTLDTVCRYGSSGNAVFFGAWYSDSYWTGYGLNLNYGSSRAVHGDKYSAGYFTITNVDNSIIRSVCTSQSCEITWDGVTRSVSSTVGFNGEQIYLLGNGRTITAGGNGSNGMGETVIMRRGVEVAHFYPCVRLSDNAPVFWDSIAQYAVENTGTGTAGVVELGT